MPILVEIADLSLPGLMPYRGLTENQLRTAPGQGLFIAESGKVIGHALDAGYEPVSLLMEKRQLAGQGREVLEKCGDIPVYVGERELLSSLTGYALTRGILCAMRRRELPEMAGLLRGARRVAVLEGLTDSTNIGAIFRSAAALQMDAVLLSPDCCDPLCRRAVRVSMGTVFQVPWAYCPAPWPRACMDALKQEGFHTAALALRPGALPLDAPELAAHEKLALFLGTEGTGLTEEALARCDDAVIIPMRPGVDSLNVAAAAAVAFWELRVRDGRKGQEV